MLKMILQLNWNLLIMLNNFMQLAIIEAKKCVKDVPVGAIIVYKGRIIAAAHNLKEEHQDATAHAEILAIQEAQKQLGTWHLNECEMYVTLEPCPMCGWAIIQSRIQTLYYGSYDTQYGAFSVLNLNTVANSKINIYGGITEEKCDKLLETFFEKIR